MKTIKIGYIMGLCMWAMPLACMMEQIADELEQEKAEHIIKKLGGKIMCDKLLAQWSEYEKQLLVTVLHECTWPSHKKGAPLYFAQNKEVYADRFDCTIDNKKWTIAIADFKILAELHRVPLFASYTQEMLKFAKIREHFATEDETWEQLNRQLTRGK